MAESKVSVTEGSGKNFHTFDRTVSSVLVQDQFTVPGEYPYASYVVFGAGISIATANDHVLQIMAGSSNHVRIRRIRVEQFANATTAAATSMSLYRLTTAGTGGTSVTPARHDLGDAVAGATAMTLPTVKGTEAASDTLRWAMLWRQAVATTGAQFDDYFEWTQMPGQKPIIIPAGTSNGVAIKTNAAVAGATVIVTVEFTETPYL